MIIIKSRDEIERIKKSSQIAAQILNQLAKAVKPGIRTIELENLALTLFEQEQSIPAFKGYNGYPANICVSVNDVVVHGIPGKYLLKEGDIVSIDVGVLKDGFYGDVAATFAVGNISKKDEQLIAITKRALFNAIEKARVGNRLSDISSAVEDTVVREGYSIVKDFVGHGIGENMHEDPQIPNFRSSSKGPVLREGMVLAIEPMINSGTYQVKVDKDGWTVRTKDSAKSAHFEHTIVILKDGSEILSKV